MAMLPSPEVPIAGPILVLMELLILLLAPAIVLQMVALRTRAKSGVQAWGIAALVFGSLLAGVTSAVHFTILTVAGHPKFASLEVAPFLLSFRWPSVAYALDILAWDLFFPLAVVFAGLTLTGSGLEAAIRRLFFCSGALALAGIAGVFWGDMNLRNIGILGYAVVYPLATGLLTLLFFRERRLRVDA
ncbi:hypothetical protein ACFSX5_09870 [Devosia albogilva]|uniref:Uncharacterized protein n=1 Tax=Devosia albogilva TaxID=429726 RepID=A0ABW5QK80_9HYPH